MNEGSILATFLVVFRESLEAGLILGIILTVLFRLGQKRYVPHVLMSSLAGILTSIAAGLFILHVLSSAQGTVEKVIEGVISLAACGVLTYMIFWMDRQAKRIRPEIEMKVEAAVTQGELLTLMALPFLAIFREGAETVLFLSAIANQGSGAVSFWGGASGFAAAAVVTVSLFALGKRIPLRALFSSTGFFLLLVSAGLLAYGIHELEEVGIIPQVLYPVWNINPILNEKEGVGSFLKALFGYNGNPSLTEVLFYFGYLTAMPLALRKRRDTPELAVQAV